MKYNSSNICMQLNKKEKGLGRKSKRKELPHTVNQLNQLLANYQVYYQNLQTFLWNLIDVDNDMHKKFEVLHNNAASQIKKVAEHILALEHQPKNQLATYLNLAEVKESQGKLPPKEMLMNILETHKILIKYFQKTINAASKTGDIETIDMISKLMKTMDESVDKL